MASSGELVVAAAAGETETAGEKLYVAVGGILKQSKSMLRWALHNSSGGQRTSRSICILHVHQPPHTVPVLGARFMSTAIEEREVRAYQRVKLQEMNYTLDNYLSICLQLGVRAEKLYIEHDVIEEGILELIRKHNITRLVMGAAADRHYSSSMMDIRSAKARTVSLKAPASCHVSFVCNGFLVHIREGILEKINGELRSRLHQPSPSMMDYGDSNLFRSRSVPSSNLQTPYTKPTNLVEDMLRRVQSCHPMCSQKSAATTTTTTTTNTTVSPLISGSTSRATATNTSSINDLDSSFIDFEFQSSHSTTSNSRLSSCSTGRAPINDVAPTLVEEESNEAANLELMLLQPAEQVVSDGGGDVQIVEPVDDDDLNRTMEEYIRSRRVAMEEAVRRAQSEEKAFEDLISLRNKASQEAKKRAKAEKSAAEALKMARALEDLFAEEWNKRKEAEEKLGQKEEEVINLKKMQGDAMTILDIALDMQGSLSSQVANSDQMVKALEQRIVSAMQQLQRYKNERDEPRADQNDLFREAEEQRRNNASSSSSSGGGRMAAHLFPQFSALEIKEATNDMDPALKIGQGGFGSIYKSELCGTKVAIKVLDPHGLQGPSEFQKEVDILSKMRHPNLVTLIGACPETCSLVYEYLPNGSLEDRLNCKDNSAPMSWQTKVRIAMELCSVLIFLHSNKPDSIVHGDIKPSNILLDANLVTKLSDFGIARLLHAHEDGDNNKTVFWRTDPKGTPFYMDPEFFSTGKLTAKSDVYLFGVILLRLLTGRLARGIVADVRYAVSSGRLGNWLDPLAGEWPELEVKELAELALRCCEVSSRNRPDLALGVWKVLKQMEEAIVSSVST